MPPYPRKLKQLPDEVLLELSVAYLPAAARKTAAKPYREEIIENSGE